jgi:hypothetical protein
MANSCKTMRNECMSTLVEEMIVSGLHALKTSAVIQSGATILEINLPASDGLSRPSNGYSCLRIAFELTGKVWAKLG